VRALLDEHFPVTIAVGLRARGHDIIAVQERRDLLGADDAALLSAAARDGRAIVTEDRVDFGRLLLDPPEDVLVHAGLVFVSPARFSRRPAGHMALIDALAALMAAHPGEVGLRGAVVWLAGPGPMPAP
jgi:hypothetical protein